MNLQSILSPQQIRIYKLKQQGYKNREIAELIETSVDNIKKQIKKIKLKIENVKRGPKIQKITNRTISILKMKQTYRKKHLA